MATRKHKAATGKRIGQYVDCNAEQKCRIRGEDEHVSTLTFEATKLWLKKNGEKATNADIGSDDIEKFQQSNDSLEYTAKADKAIKAKASREAKLAAGDAMLKNRLRNVHIASHSTEPARRPAEAPAASSRATFSTPVIKVNELMTMGSDLSGQFAEWQKNGVQVTYEAYQKGLVHTTYFNVKATGPEPEVRRFQSWLAQMN